MAIPLPHRAALRLACCVHLYPRYTHGGSNYQHFSYQHTFFVLLATETVYITHVSCCCTLCHAHIRAPHHTYALLSTHLPTHTCASTHTLRTPGEIHTFCLPGRNISLHLSAFALAHNRLARGHSHLQNMPAFLRGRKPLSPQARQLLRGCLTPFYYRYGHASLALVRFRAARRSFCTRIAHSARCARHALRCTLAPRTACLRARTCTPSLFLLRTIAPDQAVVKIDGRKTFRTWPQRSVYHQTMSS